MKKIILLMIFLVCIPIIFADENVTEDYEFTVESVKDSIYLNETAEFLLKIKNNLEDDETFRLNTPEVEWSTNLPLEIKAIAGEETSETIKVSPIPKYIASSGLYGVKITIKGAGEIVEKLLNIGVRDFGESGYSATIKTTIDMATQIDPREPITAKITFENLNKLNFPDLRLKIYGDLPELKKEQKISIGPLEKKVIEVKLNLNPAAQPDKYRVYFELLKGDQIIEKADTKTIEVIAFTPKFKEDIETSSFLLKTSHIITYSSDSNIRNSQTVKFPTGMFTRLITTTDPNAYALKEDEKKYLAWDLELGPGESKIVKVNVNYRLIIYLIAIIIIALSLYIKYKSPMIIRKSISNISTKEGGLSEMKVMLDISNPSKKEFRDIEVVDVIPNIAEGRKEEEEGTMKPVKTLKHRKRGTIMKWKIAEIAPGEERLISYHIKSKLSIIGNFKLPRAKMKFKDNKRTVITRSNTVGVSA
ncbi:hypothetical protein KY317_01555 [Candidatus Woesearchaeota archaeon]|nr:hypothetical protein [Candidatus Woesearchaeota archaeon]